MNLDWYSVCEKLTNSIWECIEPIVGTKEGGTRIQRYKTKTKKIDAYAEDVVINYLKKENMDILLCSEEIGEMRFGSAPKYTMILDPVDGTTNSLKGLPFFSTSIAIAKGNRIEDLIFGYIRNYLAREVFVVDQNGAYFNKKKSVSSSITSMGKALVSLYSYSYVDHQLIWEILKKIRKMRLLGAVSIELAYVGCRKLDGLIDLRGDLKISDIAAGILFIEKAGGVVSDAQGKEISGKISISKGYTILAAGNKVLHDKFLRIINP